MYLMWPIYSISQGWVFWFICFLSMDLLTQGYGPSDTRTKVLSFVYVSNTILEKFFFNRNPASLLSFSIYRSDLKFSSHWASITSEKFLGIKKKKKTFDYIIHFLFIWRLGKVLFKMKRWRQKFKSVYCCHRGYILLILCLKSQWCFYTCNTRGSLVSLRWNVWLWNVRHLSGNRVVMCKMKCFSDISYITWNSLWNASRYSPSLYLESLKFLFLWRLEKETWNI